MKFRTKSSSYSACRKSTLRTNIASTTAEKRTSILMEISLKVNGQLNGQKYWWKYELGLFILILYVSVTNFQSCPDESSWVTSSKQWIKCLAQGHNTGEK